MRATIASVTATIAGLQSPQQMVSSPTKSLIYVSAGTSIIYVINTATNVVASVLALPFYQSTSIAISSDGNTLYVVGTAAGAGPGTLVSISTTTFQILESVALVDAPVTLPANGLATTPFYVSKSSPIFVNDPNSGPQSNRVQCMNNSGQNLSIQCGGFNYFVAPYSVATFDTRRSSTLAVGWSGTNVNSAGYASFNWLTPRDEMPIADGPLSAQGVAGAIG